MDERSTLLIVDDEPGVRESLRQMFLGHRTVEATNGSEALAALAAQPISVAILDLRMEGNPRDTDLLDQVRTEFPHVPVVVLSACEDKDTIDHALRLGCAYLIKCRVDIPTIQTTVLNAKAPPVIVVPPAVQERIEVLETRLAKTTRYAARTSAVLGLFLIVMSHAVFAAIADSFLDHLTAVDVVKYAVVLATFTGLGRVCMSYPKISWPEALGTVILGDCAAIAGAFAGLQWWPQAFAILSSSFIFGLTGPELFFAIQPYIPKAVKVAVSRVVGEKDAGG